MSDLLTDEEGKEQDQAGEERIKHRVKRIFQFEERNDSNGNKDMHVEKELKLDESILLELTAMLR